jgi:hypothetical protein
MARHVDVCHVQIGRAGARDCHKTMRSGGKMLSAVEELIAIKKIEEVMARRLRAMDTKDWALYRAVHTADAVMESFANFPGGARPTGTAADGRVVGRDNVTAAIRSLMEEPVAMVSIHHVHSREISFPSNTIAVGIWAMEDRLSWQNGAVEEQLHGFGHYHEDYRFEDGVWRISRRRVARQRVTTTPNFYDKTREPVDRGKGNGAAGTTHDA